jgi:hypothetical protein
VFETQGAGSEHLGEDWVCDVVQKYGNTLSAMNFDRVWKESLGGKIPDDDAAVLIINQSGFQL